MMKSNRLFAAAALIGAISFSMPLVANAQDNAVESGAKEMYHGTKTEVTDTAITTKVKTALDTDPITKSSTIHVVTENGVVTLSGDVANASVSEQAERIAQSTASVKSVTNQLTVQSASNSAPGM
jgi:hyperosmotically inducible protein